MEGRIRPAGLEFDTWSNVCPASVCGFIRLLTSCMFHCRLSHKNHNENKVFVWFYRKFRPKQRWWGDRCRKYKVYYTFLHVVNTFKHRHEKVSLWIVWSELCLHSFTINRVVFIACCGTTFHLLKMRRRHKKSLYLFIPIHIHQSLNVWLIL